MADIDPTIFDAFRAKIAKKAKGQLAPWKCIDAVETGCREGFAAGTAWSDVPDDWCCPDCGVREKVDFVPVEPAQV